MSNDQHEPNSTQEPVRARPVALIAGLVVMALVLGLVLLRWPPPSPKAADAPPEAFSAGRAVALVGELLAEGQTHPIGTPANELVGGRVVAGLESLGYQPEAQDTIVCRSESGFGATCAPVHNIVTRLPGQADGPAVMLLTH